MAAATSKSRSRKPTAADAAKADAAARQEAQLEATHQVKVAQHRVAGVLEALVNELQVLAPALPPVPARFQQLVQALSTAVVSITSLFLTQGLIDNRTEKLVTGGASVLIPLTVLVAVWVSQALHQNAQARVSAAQVTAKLDSRVAAIKTASLTSFRAASALESASANVATSSLPKA